MKASGLGNPVVTRWLKWLPLAMLLLSGITPGRATAEVIFIDPEAVRAAAMTNAVPLQSAVHLTVAVIRFLPEGKSARRNDPLPTNSTLAAVVETLGKRGQVNLLFFGERDLSNSTNTVIRFDSTERRPAFSLDADTNHSLTNREFGLRLQISAQGSTDQRLALDWTGNFSWSPNLLDAWAGEKYLLFGMKVAKLLKPGSVYSDDEDEEERSGINIGSFFKKKPKETKTTNAPPEASFLGIERHEADLKGHQLVDPLQLIISATPCPNQTTDQPEFIYLIQQFSRAN